MLTIAILFVFIVYLYILSVGGRTGNPGLQKLRGWSYAHRGLHAKPEVGENSLTAFRLAAEKGYGAEFDVHLMTDGNLAVIHDSSLKRTAGAEVDIEDLTIEDLENYHLEASEDTIPTFRQVLDVFEGKAPVIIELKTKGNNGAKLSETVCRELEGYRGDYCIESFDPRCLMWMKKHRPEIVRGQLSQNFIKGQTAGMGKLADFALSYMLENFLTKPDFVAYNFDHRKNLSNRIALKLYGVQGVSWTLKRKEDYDVALEEGLLPIFEQFEP